MELNLSSVITDPYILRENFMYRNGFVFTRGQQFPPVFDRIVIRFPKRARADETKMGYSERSLDEHINLINIHHISKALIICDDLNFLLECPTLNDLVIRPSYGAKDKFDYSIIYSMPHIVHLDCRTTYGDRNHFCTAIDYSNLHYLESISMVGKGHLGFEKLQSLKKVWISENKSIRDFYDLNNGSSLMDVTLFRCGIKSLHGIQLHSEIKHLTLWHNKTLEDISPLKYVADSIEELSIDACSKINDFSVLNNLKNLNYLYLDGNNRLPNLDFLREMKKLKVFSFTMDVEDGNLNNCLNIPYVNCKNRKHFNLKDKDLPKSIPN